MVVHLFTIKSVGVTQALSKAPSERGKKFSSLPQLCMLQQGQLELVEAETLLHACNWNLFDYPAELKNFTSHETSNSFAIDIDGKKVIYKISEQKKCGFL